MRALGRISWNTVPLATPTSSSDDPFSNKKVYEDTCFQSTLPRVEQPFKETFVNPFTAGTPFGEQTYLELV